MALQNLKQAQFTGADYGQGTGSQKIVNLPDTAVASTAQGAPIITTQGFSVPLNAPNWVIPTAATNLVSATFNTANPGADCFFINRNANVWLTLVVTMPAVSTSGPNPDTVTVYYPIPPNGQMFLPRGLMSVSAILGGNPYNGLQPSPIQGADIVTLDQVVEY